MSSSSAANSSLRPAWHRDKQGGGRGFQPPPQVASERSRSTSDTATTTTTSSTKTSSGPHHHHSGGPTTTTASTTQNYASVAASALEKHHHHPQQPPHRETSTNFNKFAALDDDDDAVASATGEITSSGGVGSTSNANNTRSAALRSISGSGAGSRGSGTTSSSSGGRTGRSLADLAASSGSNANSTTTTTAPVERSGRFGQNRSNSIGERETSSGGGVGSSGPAADLVKVTRFTRERLLSMRPPPAPTAPAKLVQRLGEGSVILSDVPQDPVCWDTFDAEEIWATAAPRRSSVTKTGVPGGAGTTGGTGLPAEDAARRLSGGLGQGIRGSRSESISGPGGAGRGTSGRWQRGVALPPPDQTAGKGKLRGDRDADDPSELWDDPATSTDGAALDFSAFGSIPTDDDGEDTAFDFSKMAEATKKFEEELHGSSRSRASSAADSDTKDNVEADTSLPISAHIIKVDPKRPLATDGTTIRSGSGDNVNVFEDFDDPANDTTGEGDGGGGESAPSPPAIIKAADEDPDASSRLMALIGVKKEEAPSVLIPGISPIVPAAQPPAPIGEQPKLNAWGIPDPIMPSKPETSVLGIPLNPWGGDPILSATVSSQSQNDQGVMGLDLQARLREAEREQKAREAEEMRLRALREQEEAQRRVAFAAQQQAAEQQERARQASIQQQQQQQQQNYQQQQQQQQAGVQSQVEGVLMERISTILENSWGRSDFISILSTLHAEDSRVIPLLSNVDALRALLLRNPQRVAVRQDPTLRAEMAALLMTNAQWQQHQQQQAAQQQAQQRLRAQQEELQRREQQRRIEEQQAAAARAAQQQQVSIIPDAPWYYSDPQKNIQGPFRGEEMRQWLEAGYFKGDLPISQQPMGPFRLLSSIFPDLSVAFIVVQRSTIAEQQQQAAEAAARAAAKAAEAEQRARLEAEQQQQQRIAAEQAAAAAAAEREREERERQIHAAERERQARQAAAERQRLVTERERQAKEAADLVSANEAAEKNAAASVNNNGGNESSTQLKMLLGLNAQFASGTQSQVVISSTQEQQSQHQPQPKSSLQQKPVQPNEKKAPKSKNERQQQQHQQPAPPPPPAEEKASPNVSPAPASSFAAAAPAWGGVAATKPVARKSMSEIQQEEARAAAAAAAREEGTKVSTSGWANVAASRGGSNAWAGGAASTQKPAVVISKSPGSTTMATVAKTAGTQALRSASLAGVNISSSTVAPQAQQQMQRSSSLTSGPSSSTDAKNAASADAFGAKMSPALEKWCKDQMQKLNGTDDLTLVSFCMTLTDGNEIRQYLNAYLGSSAAVNNFATEFINRKGGVAAKNSESEWEQTVTGSKKSKKNKNKASGSNR